MDTITIETKYTEEEAVRAGLHITWQAITTNKAFLILPLAFLAIIAVASKEIGVVGFVISILIIGLVIYYGYYFTKRTIIRNFHANARNQEYIRFSLTEKECSVEGTSFSVVTPWTEIVKVERWKDYYLIYSTTQHAHLIRISSIKIGDDDRLIRLFDKVQPGWKN